jgi:hypothetical protein
MVLATAERRPSLKRLLSERISVTRGIKMWTYGLLMYSSQVTYAVYGTATVPTITAMYVEARVAH